MLCFCVGDVMDVMFSVCIVRRGAVGQSSPAKINMLKHLKFNVFFISNVHLILTHQ